MKKKWNYLANTSRLKRLLLCLTILTSISWNTKATTVVALKFYIEGYYVGGSLMKPVRLNQGCTANNASTITSEVTVKIIEVGSNMVQETTTAILNTDGTCLVTFSGTYLNLHKINVSGCGFTPYCSEIVNLNGAIPIMDFSIAPTLGGDAQIEVEPGIYAFASGGDINQDGAVDAFDYILMDFDLSNFIAGCNLCTDLNGSGKADLGDMVMVANNVYMFFTGGCYY